MRCERARSWISLELDGELSEIESALLRAHLSDCAGCREFKLGAADFTSRLRQAPLEPLERPIALPERRRVLLRPAQVGAAAAAALVVAIAGAGTVASVGSNHSGNVVGASSRDDALAFRKVRRQAILSSVPVLVGKAGGRPIT
jgi:predicted anti-sigma-YlaC factor YlaD